MVSAQEHWSGDRKRQMKYPCFSVNREKKSAVLGESKSPLLP